MLAIDNVDPTATIDETGATDVNGVPTFIAHAGEPLDFSGRSTDPGSDDLTVSWDWDDGLPSPDEVRIYRVNPPLPDPPKSPSIQPRDITDATVHAFGDACLFEITFASADDDGGAGSDAAAVIITGNADATRSAGYWHSQYAGTGNGDLSEAELECYLAIAGFMSQVFDEETDASTIALAEAVLSGGSAGGDMKEIFDRQLLAAWLNFANGAIDLTTLVDSDGDGTPDTAFGDVIGHAEDVRLDPNSARGELEAQKDLLEDINEGRA